MEINSKHNKKIPENKAWVEGCQFAANWREQETCLVLIGGTFICAGGFIDTVR